MLGRVIPWLELSRHTKHNAEIRERAAATAEEQTNLSEYIDAQADYLEEKAEINGFSRQLLEGFHLRLNEGG